MAAMGWFRPVTVADGAAGAQPPAYNKTTGAGRTRPLGSDFTLSVAHGNVCSK